MEVEKKLMTKQHKTEVMSDPKFGAGDVREHSGQTLPGVLYYSELLLFFCPLLVV